jgi:hypothetical protein
MSALASPVTVQTAVRKKITGRVQNVSKTREESQGFERMPVNDQALPSV